MTQEERIMLSVGYIIVIIVEFCILAIMGFVYVTNYQYFHIREIISPVPEGKVIIPLRDLPIKECHYNDWRTEYVYPDEPEYFTGNPCEDGIDHSPPPPSQYRGRASYYSRAGCVGCRVDRLMANGEPLDDSRLTVAYNKAPLGSVVKVRNIKSDIQVEAIVTDRGGFERYGKIIDLSLATKEALMCGDVCEVEVIL